MLSVQGNDAKKKQIPPAYETEYSAIQSKKIGIRRKNFQDTDNNKEDTEAADYSQNDVSLILPHSTSAGDWYRNNLRAQAEAVIKSLPKFYDVYCDNETAEKVKELTDKINAALKDLNSETLAKLFDEAAKLKLKFKSDEKVPQIYVATEKNNGITLRKAEGYMYAQITCIDTDGSITASDLSYASQIKVHGNATAGGAKRPYNLKFNKKVNLFGMGKAKKWVLLADMYDNSLMRNKTALTLGKKLGLEATMDCQRVELWVDGSYRGLYLLTEKIEADENRVNINTESGDFILELDIVSRTEAGNIYLTTSSGKYYRLRDPEEQEAVNEVKAKVNEFENILKSGSWEQVKEIIDLDSFVSYYILNDFMKSIDFYQLSVYFYYKDGKFYAGPAWDYDCSCGNVGRTYKGHAIHSTEGSFADLCHYYADLIKFPEFKLAIFKKFLEINNKNLFEDIYNEGGFIENDSVLYSEAISRNNTAWNKTAAYESGIKSLLSWLKARNEWMQSYFLNKVYDSTNKIYYYDYLKDLKTDAMINVGDENYHIYSGGKIGNGTSSFITYNGEYYYVDSDGKIITGNINTGGNNYVTDENGQILPQSLNVEISGKKLIHVETGNSETFEFTASASNFYGSGLSTKLLASDDYTISWTSDAQELEDFGISFSDGTLSVNSSAKAGIYDINIKAEAESGNVKGYSEIAVKIIVNNAGAIITPNTITIEAQKGIEIEIAKISVTQGQNITWSIEGDSLPAGLVFTSSEDSAEISGTPEIGTSGFYEYVIIASNDEDFDTADVFITVTGSAEGEIIDGVFFEGSRESPDISQVVFRNAGGEIMASADVKIVADSAKFTGTTGQNFAKIITVETDLYIADSDYDEYNFSMDISGLPQWLKTEGELLYSSLASSDEDVKFNHVFMLSGTPSVAGNYLLNFIACVEISGDIPLLAVHESRNIAISIAQYVQPSPAPSPSPSPSPTPSPKPDSDSDSENDDVTPTPKPTPEPDDVTPTPQPDPKPDDVSPIPEPEPKPESDDVTPEPEPEPESVDVIPVPEPEPESDDISPNPDPIPEPESNDVEPSPTPSPNPDTNPDDDKPDESEKIFVIDKDISDPVSAIEEMSESERQKITTLEVTGDIQNINEIISLLENLEHVDLTNANSVDNVDLSNNNSVKELEISGNSSIKSLVLSNSNIENLNAEDCNNLEEVDVSGCNSLRELKLNKTEISSLNAQDCENLEVLECGSCKLSSINLEGCKSLSKIILDGNSLAAFDAYNFTKLIELSCSGQEIEGWNVGKNFNFGLYLNSVSVAADDEYSNNFLGFENIADVKAWDKLGREISVEYDKTTGEAKFSGTPYKLRYEYITGFEDVNMDVTVFADSENINDDNVEHERPNTVNNNFVSGSSSSGGCNMAFNSLFILSVLVMFRKRG